MRIDPEIIGSSLRTTFFVELHRIQFFFASEIVGPERFFETVFSSVGETMPAPLRLSAQRHSLAVSFGKSLQTGNVDGKSEITVTQR